MACTSSSGCRIFSSATALITIASALGFASPAMAETKTLSCEGEVKLSNAVESAPWSGSIDIDYTAATISFPSLHIAQEPADVTERAISFDSKNNNFGSLDRLSGTLVLVKFLGQGTAQEIQGRCRAATQKF